MEKIFLNKRLVFRGPHEGPPPSGAVNFDEMLYGVEDIDSPEAERKLIETLSIKIRATETEEELQQLFEEFENQWKRDFRAIGYDLDKDAPIRFFDEEKLEATKALLDRVLVKLAQTVKEHESKIKALKYKILTLNADAKKEVERLLKADDRMSKLVNKDLLKRIISMPDSPTGYAYESPDGKKYPIIDIGWDMLGIRLKLYFESEKDGYKLFEEQFRGVPLLRKGLTSMKGLTPKEFEEELAFYLDGFEDTFNDFVTLKKKFGDKIGVTKDNYNNNRIYYVTNKGDKVEAALVDGKTLILYEDHNRKEFNLETVTIEQIEAAYAN